MNLEDLLAAEFSELAPTEEQQPEPMADRSATGEVFQGLKLGVRDTLPRLVGQGMKWFSEPGAPTYEAGESLRVGADIRGADPQEQLQPEAHNMVVNSLAGGAEMLPASVGPQALAVVGDLLFPPGAPVFHALAATGTGLGFGASQAQDSYERVLEETGDKEKARKAGWYSGAIEGGGEALASYIGGKYLTGALKVLGSKNGATVVEKVLSAAKNPQALKNFAKATGANAATEVSTEMGQNAGETAVEQAYGVTNGPTPGRAALDAISPTLGMSALMIPFGGVGAYRQNQQTKNMLNLLEDPAAPMDERAQAAAFFQQEMAKDDQPAADMWAAQTLLAISQGKGINVVDPKSQQPEPQSAPTAEQKPVQGMAPEPIVESSPPLQEPQKPQGPLSKAVSKAEGMAPAEVSPIVEPVVQDQTVLDSVPQPIETVNGDQVDPETGEILQEADDLPNDLMEELYGDLPEMRQETGNTEEMSPLRGKNEAVESPVVDDQEATQVDALAHEAATSPTNDVPEPTEAQKEAGNYKMGHARIQGMDISIENPAGSVRKGTDEDGKAWETPINHHYGYVKNTVGFDKDHLDIFLGPEAETADTAYVIDQKNKDGSFDEHKAVIGAADANDALAIYNSNYEEGWDGAGAITAMPVDEFKQWAKSDAPKQGALSYKEKSNGETTTTTQGEQTGTEGRQGAESTTGELREEVVSDGSTVQQDNEHEMLKTVPDIVSVDDQKAGLSALAKQSKSFSEFYGAVHANAVADEVSQHGFAAAQPSFPEALGADNADAALAALRSIFKSNQADVEAAKAKNKKAASIPTLNKRAKPLGLKISLNKKDGSYTIKGDGVEKVVADRAEAEAFVVEREKGLAKDTNAKQSEVENNNLPVATGETAGRNDSAAENERTDKKENEVDEAGKKAAKESIAPEHEAVGVDDRELDEIVGEFNAIQRAQVEDENTPHHLFDPPAKKDIVRLNDKVRVYVSGHGWISPPEAKESIRAWEDHAVQQGKDAIAGKNRNSDKVVLSLFDKSGEWSLPWEQAGYQVYRFDIQDGWGDIDHNGTDINPGDINNFSTDFFNDIFGSFDGNHVHAILAACPCTDFAVSGARHFAAKDKDGRTVASVALVHQTLATIEYFKPSVWALENPVGRIEKLGGLPPWRLSFDPYHIGDNYTKKTLLWGRFNADLPIAPVEPTEGSKMHKRYGGKSLATKNARSVTPEGFAYSFFMANNAIDHPVMAIANKYDRLDREVIESAVAAGMTEQEIDEIVEDLYYQDLDDDAAEAALDKASFDRVMPSEKEIFDYFDSVYLKEKRVLGNNRLIRMAADHFNHPDWEMEFAKYAVQWASDAKTGKRAEPSAVNNRDKQKKSGESIDDFGEVLIGAKKHYAQKMSEAEKLDTATVPLSKAWPEPDYEKLIEQGFDPDVVAMVRAMREEVPAKGRSGWKVKRYVEAVEMLRGFASNLLSGAISKEELNKKLNAEEFRNLKEKLLSVADLYQAVGHKNSLKGIKVSVGRYSLYNGEEFNPPKTIWSVSKKAKATAFSNWPTELATGDTREEAIANFKQKADKLLGDLKAKSRGTKFVIYTKRDTKKTYIGKKFSSRRYLDIEEFDSVKEARVYLSENQDKLEAKLEKIKNLPSERKETNAPRVGEDHLGGQDVTPEMFSSKFGFRGVQFGNYVDQKKRQSDLNEAYDALMDMAGVLGVPAKAVSLNGELGLAFGARGSGGKGAAAAHYEPGTMVINLTKKSGAGSLAHEWWHSLDNYFNRQRGEGSYFTNNPRAKTGYNEETGKYGNIDPTRQEMIDAFAGIMKAINATGLKERSTTTDQAKSKPYWATDVEMSARAFENYIIEKLNDNNGANDYLANIVSQEVWDAETALGLKQDGSYPYLTKDEIPGVKAAYQHFFDVIETKETDKGTALFRKNDDKRSAPLSAVEFDAALTRITSGAVDREGFTVVETAADLPEAILADADNYGGNYDQIDGVFHDGKVYIVRQHISSVKELESIVFHEWYGHAGLYAMMGNDGVAARKKMVELYDLIPPGKMLKIANKYGFKLSKYAKALREAKDYKGKPLTDDARHAVLMEEMLAYLTEEYSRGSIATKVKEIIGMIRAWLRKHNFAELAKLNEADLALLLKQARTHAEMGAWTKKKPLVFNGVEILQRLREKGVTDEQLRGLVGGLNAASEVRYSLNPDNDPEILQRMKDGLYVSERINAETLRLNQEKRTELAEEIARRGVRSVRLASEIAGKTEPEWEHDGLAETELFPAERKELQQWAEENNLIIPTSKFEKPWKADGKRGMKEHDVYFNEQDGRWYKRQRFTLNKSYTDYFQRILLTNALNAGKAEIRLEGFTVEGDNLFPIVSQADIPSVREVTVAEVNRLMQAEGFTRIDQGEIDYEGKWRFPGEDYVASDLYGPNVAATADGDIIFIDPLIKPDAVTKKDRIEASILADKYGIDSSMFRLRDKVAATKSFAKKLTPDTKGEPFKVLADYLPERMRAAIGGVLSNPHYGSRKSKWRSKAYALALERGANANEIKHEIMASKGGYRGLEGLRNFYREASKTEREQIDKLLVEGDINSVEYSEADLDSHNNPFGAPVSATVKEAYFSFRETVDHASEEMFERLGRLRLLPYEGTEFHDELVKYLDDGLSGSELEKKLGINIDAVNAYKRVIGSKRKIEKILERFRRDSDFDGMVASVLAGTNKSDFLRSLSSGSRKAEASKIRRFDEMMEVIKESGEKLITADKYRSKKHFQQLRELLVSGKEHEMLVKAEIYFAYLGVREYDSQLAKLKDQWGKVKGYLPRLRKDGEQHVKVFQVDEDGAFIEVWMQPAKTKAGADRLRNKVEANLQEYIPHSFDSEAQYHVVVEPNQATPEEIFLGIGSHRAIEALLSRTFEKALDAGVIADQLTVQRQVLRILSDEISARGFGRHKLHRAEHLIEGYETANVPGILSQFIGGMAGWLSKSEFAMRGNRLMSEIPGDKPQDKVWVKDYVDDALKNSTYIDQWFGTARSFAALMFLGFKASSAMLNATQNYIWGQAVLGKHTKGATRKLLASQRDVIKDHLLRAAGKEGALTEEETWVLEEGLRRGRSHANYVRAMSGLDDNGGVLGKGQAGLRWLTEKAMIPFQAVETYWNREPALLAAYRIFKAKGMSKEAALKEAEKFVDDVHFVVGKENIPALLRKLGPFGRTLYTFQSYSHNYLLGMLTSLSKGEFNVVMRSLTALVLFGGLAAVPFGDDLDKWYRRLFGERPLRMLEKWIRETGHEYTDFGDQIADFVMHGAPALGGVNFSRAIAVNVPWLSPDDDSLAERVTGVWGGLAQKVRYAGSSVGKGDLYRATEYISPEALANVLRAYRHYADGATTMSGKPVFGDDGKQVKYTAKDAIIRTFGFMPLEPSKQSQNRWDAVQAKKFWQDQKSDLLARYRSTRDNAARKEVYLEIVRFNKRLRGAPGGVLVPPITGKTLKQALRSRPNRREMVYNQ